MRSRRHDPQAPVDGTCPVQIPRQAGGWQICARPLQGGTICPSCMSDLAARVDAVPQLQLVLRAIAEGKEASSTAGQGAHALPGPRPPLNVAALDAIADLRKVLAGWAATWGTLNLRDPAVRRHPLTAVALVEIDREIDAARRITDPPAAALRPQCPECGERVPIPPDPHDGQTLPDGRPVRCPGCVTIRCSGWHHDDAGFPTRRCDAAGNRAWWAATAGVQDDPVPLTLLPWRLESWGYRVKPRQVRDWADRGLIEPDHVDGRRRMYKPTAVALVAQRMAERKRRAKGTA